MSLWLRVGITMDIEHGETRNPWVQMSFKGEPVSLSPKQAREVATLLLLNADRVERQKEGRLVEVPEEGR